jgi:hypothetical protein
MIIPMQKMLEDRVSEAKQSLAPLAKMARNTMKEYPGVVVASALGIGLFSGAMMRRTAAVGATTTIGLLAAWYLTRRPAAMSVSAVAADKS